MFAVKTVNGNAKPRMLVAFPFHHIVLGLPEESVLRTEKRGKAKQVAVVPLENVRSMLELSRYRCGM
jgi:hypothetical protein